MEPEFTKYNDFALESIGAKVLFATDDFFAVSENLILDSDPVFITDKFTEFGKWMDGWETRRKRIPGHDWCIIKLATLCYIRGVLVDTAFFIGNFAPKYSIQGINVTSEEESMIPTRNSQMGSMSNEQDLRQIKKLNSEKWPTLVSMTELRPGNEKTRLNYKSIQNHSAVSHIRLNIYPDGGIARLRIFGKVAQVKPPSHKVFDLLSVLNGATCQGYSNAHFGHPRNVMKPRKSITMADGWETARRLDRPPIIVINPNGTSNVPGEEWAVFNLAYKGTIKEFLLDTAHFKGNYPDTVKIEGTTLTKDWSPSDQKNIVWETILPHKKLSPDKEHRFNSKPVSCTHIRVTMAPDGGISRIRALGNVDTKDPY